MRQPWQPVLIGRAPAIVTRFNRAMRLAERSYELHCDRMKDLRREERRSDRARTRLARKTRKARKAGKVNKWAGKGRAAARLNLVRVVPGGSPSQWLAAQLKANPTLHGSSKPDAPTNVSLLAKLKAKRLGAEPLPVLSVKAPKGTRKLAHRIAIRLVRAAGLEV